MYKKAFSFLLVLFLLASLTVPAFAAGIAVTVPTGTLGNPRISVSQTVNSTTTTTDFVSGGGTFSAADGVGVAVKVVVDDGYYATINGSIRSEDPNLTSGAVAVNVAIFDAPEVTLSANAAGGLSYSLSNRTNFPDVSYILSIYDASGNVKWTSGTLTSKTGSIALSDSIVAGQTYTARGVAVLYGSFKTALGIPSHAVAASALPTSYDLTVKSADTAGGTVVTPAASKYAEKAAVTIEAVPNTGYKFNGWVSSDGGTFESASSAKTVFTMPAKATTLTASFVKAYSFVIMSSTGGKVWDVDGAYLANEKVWVEAIPGDGYLFAGWTSSDGGSFDDSAAVATYFYMPSNSTTVTASFKESAPATPPPTAEEGEGEETPPPAEGSMFAINTASSEGGSIVITKNRGAEGEKITVRATAQAGFVFDAWSSEGGGSFADAKAASTTFTMPAADVTINAAFVAGAGAGTETPPAEGEDGEAAEGGGSLLWIILIGAGALIAVTAGILLIVAERRRRRYRNFDDGFDGRSGRGGRRDEEYEDYSEEYAEEDADEEVYEDGEEEYETEDDNRFDSGAELFPRRLSDKKRNFDRDPRDRDRRPPRNNTFRADDWEN